MILEYLFCCQYTTNHKIIDLLEDLAVEKIKSPIKPNKIHDYDDYYKLYLDTLKAFKVKETRTADQHILYSKWSSIRKKAIKDLILKNYIINVKNVYKFDNSTLNAFKRDLLIGLNCKTINDKNIVIRDSEILSIAGLHLATNSYTWDYELTRV
jgi:hypothetical protein